VVVASNHVLIAFRLSRWGTGVCTGVCSGVLGMLSCVVPQHVGCWVRGLGARWLYCMLGGW
jgi:hypothetical protein